MLCVLVKDACLILLYLVEFCLVADSDMHLSLQPIEVVCIIIKYYVAIAVLKAGLYAILAYNVKS